MKSLESERITEVERESGEVDPKARRDIMTIVLGTKSGRLLGFGLGPRAEKAPKDFSEKEKELQMQLQESCARNEELESTIKDQDKRINNLETMFSKLANIPQLNRLIQGITNSEAE